VTLTCAWGAVYPYAPAGFVVVALHCVQAHEVKTLLGLDNISDGDVSLSGCLDGTHVLNLRVASLEVSFDITLSW